MTRSRLPAERATPAGTGGFEDLPERGDVVATHPLKQFSSLGVNQGSGREQFESA